MTRFYLLACLFLTSLTLSAQILPEDSTIQVIGYWSKGEKQSYAVTYDKYKVSGKDTTNRMLVSYDVNITVKDSTEKTYLIEWYYTNFSVDTDNILVKKIMSVSENVPVLLKTDEFGAILEVANWKEVRNRTKKAFDILKKELKKIPGAEDLLGPAANGYSSKEAVEANAIKDAIQFYTFHGAAYTLNEKLGGPMQFANNLGGKPFDGTLEVMVTGLDEENDFAEIEMMQVIDSKQLTDVTYDYIKKLAGSNKSLPKRKDYPEMSNQTETFTRVHGSSGWIIASRETKIVSTGESSNVEERIIIIK